MAYTTIDKPSDYFRTKLYAGNATNNRAITWEETDTNMQPNMLWFKSRTDNQAHALFDSVRGAIKRLVPNETGAEGDEAANLDSFDTNGFTVDAEAIVNGSSRNYVTWGWKAGGSASSNSNGTITSSVSANQTAGFSIVSYTGTGSSATVGHGLGVAPKFMIIKNRSDATNWNVYTTVIDGSMDYLYLNLTDAKGNSSASLPTSTLLNLTASNDVNGSSDNMIAYCFAEKQGYSKFGGFVANGSTDNSFIYTGMKPSFVMFKRTDGTGNWGMWDNKRNTFNVMDKYLLANSSGAEGTSAQLDLLSNGIKIRTSGFSSGNWIYMTFAENPFVTSTGVCATAR